MTALARTVVTPVWLLLVVATVISWMLGANYGPGNHEAATVTVMVVSFVKVGFVGLYFMELRHAPLALRLVRAEGLLAARDGGVVGAGGIAALTEAAEPLGRVAEEDVLLGAEVAEERARRGPDLGGDLLDRRRVEALLLEQLHRHAREVEPQPRLLALTQRGHGSRIGGHGRRIAQTAVWRE